MKIYKIDNSKLIPVGEAGYVKEQEQAKTYYHSIPDGVFVVEVSTPSHIMNIVELTNKTLDVNVNKPITIAVDRDYEKRLAMTIYYIVEGCDFASHYTVSYGNCPEESDYELAEKILNYVRNNIQ